MTLSFFVKKTLIIFKCLNFEICLPDSIPYYNKPPRNNGGPVHGGRWGSDLHHIITTFIFTTLSFNGTNVTRGQVPQILYYSTPAEEPAITNGTANLAQTSRQSALAISVAVKTHHVHVQVW